MAKSTSNAPKLPSTFDVLGVRIQKIINSPAAQKAQAVVISKKPEELDDDWQLLLEQIGETDGVNLAFQDDGGVRIFWDVPDEG